MFNQVKYMKYQTAPHRQRVRKQGTETPYLGQKKDHTKAEIPRIIQTLIFKWEHRRRLTSKQRLNR